MTHELTILRIMSYCRWCSMLWCCTTLWYVIHAYSISLSLYIYIRIYIYIYVHTYIHTYITLCHVLLWTHTPCYFMLCMLWHNGRHRIATNIESSSFAHPPACKTHTVVDTMLHYLGDRIFWANSVPGNALVCVSREAAAIWSSRHCKPAACILGLTGANLRLSLTCGFPWWSDQLNYTN